MFVGFFLASSSVLMVSCRITSFLSVFFHSLWHRRFLQYISSLLLWYIYLFLFLLNSMRRLSNALYYAQHIQFISMFVCVHYVCQPPSPIPNPVHISWNVTHMLWSISRVNETNFKFIFCEDPRNVYIWYATKQTVESACIQMKWESSWACELSGKIEAMPKSLIIFFLYLLSVMFCCWYAIKMWCLFTLYKETQFIRFFIACERHQ